MWISKSDPCHQWLNLSCDFSTELLVESSQMASWSESTDSKTLRQPMRKFWSWMLFMMPSTRTRWEAKVAVSVSVNLLESFWGKEKLCSKLLIFKGSLSCWILINSEHAKIPNVCWNSSPVGSFCWHDTHLQIISMAFNGYINCPRIFGDIHHLHTVHHVFTPSTSTYMRHLYTHKYIIIYIYIYVHIAFEFLGREQVGHWKTKKITMFWMPLRDMGSNLLQPAGGRCHQEAS